MNIRHYTDIPRKKFNQTSLSFFKRQKLPKNTILKFVPQQEAWIVERMGKFSRVLEPGLAILVPFLDKIKYVKSLKEIAMEIPSQSAITLDNVTLELDGVLYVRILDPYKACYGVEDAEYAVAQLAQTTMRSEIGQLALDHVLKERQMLNVNITEAINEAAADWGIKCLRYEIRDIHPPQNVLLAMHRQVSAERSKRAEILESEGQRQSCINIAEGQKQSQILNSEAIKQESINKATGEAEAILLKATATAKGISAIASVLSENPMGLDAVNLRIAEKYVNAFGNIAKESTSIVVPANLNSDINSMVAQALTVINKLNQNTLQKKGTGTTLPKAPAVLKTTPEEKKPFTMSAPPWQQQGAGENVDKVTTASSMPLLASGQSSSLESSKWGEYKAPDGRIYWSDGKTSVWEKPDELKTEEEIEIGKLNWKEYTAPGGRKYWYNTKSGTDHCVSSESVWNMPETCKKAIEALHSSKNQAALGQKNDERTTNQDDERQMMLRDEALAIGPDGKALPLVLASGLSEEKEMQNYTSLEEAEAVFMKMLKRCGVGANWTWEQTMRSVIKQPQYRVIKDPIQRKQAFEKYVQEIQKQESKKEHDRLTKLKADFNRMLKTHPEIKYYTRWRVAREILDGETVFKATDNEEERRQLFEEYVSELKRIENENEHKIKNEAMDAFSALLESLNLKPYSRWSSAQAKFREHPDFKSNPKFQVLSNLDILIVYESHIKGLERIYVDQRQANKAKKQRIERKNREEFVKLLQDLHHEKKIGPGTKWMTIYPIIKNDLRYKNMLGQPGSTPLELFWDIVEEAERDIRHKRNLAYDILDEQRFDFNDKTTLSQFSDLMRKDKKGAEFSDHTLSSLREKVLRRLENEKRSDERRQKRRINELRYLIKHLRPPLHPEDTWPDIRKRIEHTQEFLAVDSEENRELAFKKQMRLTISPRAPGTPDPPPKTETPPISAIQDTITTYIETPETPSTDPTTETVATIATHATAKYSPLFSALLTLQRIKSDRDHPPTEHSHKDNKDDTTLIESSEEEGEIH
ncbi:hypothetical protein PMAC_002850 [Pneumocystis sp. 'macacae']|nr:hypothetical protein PMAC_002850 [Pneumocystis sp. 'macacae']